MRRIAKLDTGSKILNTVKLTLITIMQILNGLFLIGATVYLFYAILIGDVKQSIVTALSVAVMTYLAERL